MSYAKEIKDYYKLSSKDLSENSLKSLRATAMIGLLAVTMALLMIWSVIPLNPFTGWTLALGLVFGFLALLHRLPNSLMISEKHLDEWGGNAKKDAEAFAYRVVFWASIVIGFLGYALLSSDNVGPLTLVLTPSFEHLAGTFLLITFLLQMIIVNRLAWAVQPLSKEDVMEMYEVEKPRKNGKWMTIVPMCFVFGGFFVGSLIDNLYPNVRETTPQNCEISITDDAPLAQVKPLYFCSRNKENQKPKTK